jgi:hypothetical protein
MFRMQSGHLCLVCDVPLVHAYASIAVTILFVADFILRVCVVGQLTNPIHSNLMRRAVDIIATFKKLYAISHLRGDVEANLDSLLSVKRVVRVMSRDGVEWETASATLAA